MSITDERKQKVDFSNKYYQTPARFVAKKGAGMAVSKEGLKGKSVGVQRATIHENFVRDMFGDAVAVKAYATQDEANMDLVAGRVDLVIADATVLLGGFINTDAGKGFEFIGPSYVDKKWFGDGVGIALRKGDNELRQKLNKAIDAIRANGVYQKINAKYFDFDVYGK
jgi:arginine/ornithine transport system substrate-binding protein